MQQLDIIPNLFPQVLDQPWYGPDVWTGLPEPSSLVGRDARIAIFATRSICVIPGHRYMHPNMPVTAVHLLPRRFLHLLKVIAARLAVRVRCTAALAPQQPVHRHTGLFAKNVAERLVAATQCVAEHGTVPRVRADKGRLPHVFDFKWILADEKGFEVLIHSGLDRASALCKCRTPEPIQA